MIKLSASLTCLNMLASVNAVINVNNEGSETVLQQEALLARTGQMTHLSAVLKIKGIPVRRIWVCEVHFEVDGDGEELVR